MKQSQQKRKKPRKLCADCHEDRPLFPYFVQSLGIVRDICAECLDGNHIMGKQCEAEFYQGSQPEAQR